MFNFILTGGLFAISLVDKNLIDKLKVILYDVQYPNSFKSNAINILTAICMLRNKEVEQYKNMIVIDQEMLEGVLMLL